MNISRSLLAILGAGAAVTFAFAAETAGNDACCKDNSASCSEHAMGGDTAESCPMHASGIKTTVASGSTTTSEQNNASIVKAYVPIAEALAGDDATKAQHAAADLARTAKASGQTAVYAAAIGVIHGGDITAQRAAFKKLSAVVTPLAADNKEFVVMNCPMAQADWVQTDAAVRNPYYGKSMLTCGEVKK